MWSKKTFLTAAIVLILTTVANADGASHAAQVVLKVNGIDATTEIVEVEGKNELIIAVAGSTEIEPNTCAAWLVPYSVEVEYGAIEAIAGDDTNSPQANSLEYSFSFGDKL